MVSAVLLIAVVCAVIGTVTTIALHSYLQNQLDGKLRESAQHSVGRQGDFTGHRDLGFIAGPGQPIGTVGARLSPRVTSPPPPAASTLAIRCPRRT
ncbi:hypothetical protein [Streptomyces sp. Ac-502]|uniref:hypothetical protein n=1 Tax=Streptomyces sp. Ac-502 TaxID=3342801 RepID=UPI003862B9E0